MLQRAFVVISSIELKFVVLFITNHESNAPIVTFFAVQKINTYKVRLGIYMK